MKDDAQDVQIGEQSKEVLIANSGKKPNVNVGTADATLYYSARYVDKADLEMKILKGLETPPNKPESKDGLSNLDNSLMSG